MKEVASWDISNDLLSGELRVDNLFRISRTETERKLSFFEPIKKKGLQFLRFCAKYTVLRNGETKLMKADRRMLL